MDALSLPVWTIPFLLFLRQRPPRAFAMDEKGSLLMEYQIIL